MSRGGSFEAAYRSGAPPWDIGRRQPAVARLERAGEIAHKVLDVGCGTGDNAIYLARRGHEVLGIDSAPLAIEQAQAKSRAGRWRSKPRFAVHDALELAQVGDSFGAVIDCGLFHALSDEERRPYVGGLRSVLEEGGHYFMLCFSEHEPDGWGPRRIDAADITGTFREEDGFEVEAIEETRFETRDGRRGARAYLARIRRVEPRRR
ncbi:MAG TPA: class I SAM-dependent methyltransferase [Thermoleophilia bacterium]|nr:class I SAM-dependent methyltransferase [Thermoleophilia bacterium]